MQTRSCTYQKTETRLAMNIKRNVYLLLLCTFSVLPSFAQRNFAQELIDLMQQGKCFEARELRKQYSEYLPLNDKTYDLVYNGVQVEAWAGIIDSIDLKSVKLYNIPVIVHDGHAPNLSDTLNNEAKSKLDTIRNEKQVIMGLPLMKMIGKFEFDWKKRTVRFPENTGEPATNRSSNIYMSDNNLYQQLKINGQNYVGHVDTGDDDFVNMAFSFYEKNKSHIEIDSLAEKKPINHYRATGIFYNVPYEIVKDPKIDSNGTNINPNTSCVLITDGTLSHLNSFDGTIGAGLFKHLGPKVIFDFVNMEIKRKEE